jgi:translation initiation factor IF-2
MSDNNENNKGKTTLSLGGLGSKKIEAGTVRQNLSRGRSKTVTVEVRKSRFLSKKDEGQEDLSGLTEHEREARLAALKQAAEKKDSDQTTQVSKNKIEVKQSATEKLERMNEVVSAPQAQPNFQQVERPGAAATGTTAAGAAKPEKPSAKELMDDEIEGRKKATKAKLGEDKRDRGKLTIAQALAFDSEEKVRSFSSMQRQRNKRLKQQQQISSSEQGFKVKEIIIPELITVQELANRMAVRVQDVIKELMKLGMMNRPGDEIDADTAELLVTEFKHTPKRVAAADIEDKLKEEVIDGKDLVSRPPVVTVMGHVDHGKTSLLDALRSANVVSGEAGGITQHIGAYQVETHGQKITFLDTPGHAAFTAMRARGATVTDIVILVVAADDGIMPQTIEAINHAKAAGVPIVVAINKIDKPDANSKKVKEELLTQELVVEDFGGEVQSVEISAKQKLNLDKLLDAVLVQAEMLDLKASAKQKPRGTVIESRIDKGKGVVATLLVQKGTLRKGDIVVAGAAEGRVKSISDDKGNVLEEAGPSRPVEVLGFNEVPVAGEVFTKTETDKEARDIVEYRKKLLLIEKQKAAGKNTLDNLFKNAASGLKELNVIVKGDVHGSVEAINGSLEKIESTEVKVKVIHSGAGAISESDVQLANATKAIILGFNVRAEVNAKILAEQEKIDIRYYNIIYNLLDDVKLIVSGMLSPIIREVYLGSALIQQIFKMSKFGKVAGCKITQGEVKRGAGVRLIRDNVVIHEGKLKTLKRFKDEVAEVREGFECGMAFENYEDIKEGDTIEAFEKVEEKQVLAN